MAHSFVDETVILVRSGRGGDGCVSFRREKYEPRGGPDGGDGGNGGHVILQADRHKTTLLDLGRNHHYTAENGQSGRGKNCTGRRGEDLVIRVPVGTLVRDQATGELLVDMKEVDQEFRVAQGGKGGRGNKAFATATHQTPRECEEGGPAEELTLELELKLMADVGLLGLPNAGKSTLLSKISAARPRIASYPFTTLTPQLGIAELDPERRIVFADIPGLIEGAHEGVGLGIEFLRHLERTRVLLHLVEAGPDVDALAKDHRVVRNEIRSYVVDLTQRPILTVLTKVDLWPAEEAESIRESLEIALDEPVVAISSATGLGVRPLLESAWRLVRSDDAS